MKHALIASKKSSEAGADFDIKCMDKRFVALGLGFAGQAAIPQRVQKLAMTETC